MLATVQFLQTLLKSFFVFAALLSDYTLKYDEWIVTAPRANQGDDASVTRRRWLHVLKTTLSYAVLEPLFYCLMTSISNQAMWWLLMGSFMHLHAILAALRLMGECILDVKKKHDTICGDTTLLEKEEEGEAQRESATGGEKSHIQLAQDANEKKSKPDLRPCLHLHPLSTSYYLAPLWPVATAALSNAGLLFYARYLSTADSKAWLDRFAFGWVAIALLCIFIFVFARWNNKLLHQACNRPLYITVVPWNALRERLVCLFLLALVRGVVRVMLGQQPLTFFSYSIEDGIKLLGGSEVGDETSNPDASREHLFDRMMYAIPPWVGQVIVWTQCVGIWGYLGWRWWQRRREQQQVTQGQGREE